MRRKVAVLSLVIAFSLGLGVLTGMLTTGPKGATKQAGTVPGAWSYTASPAPSQSAKPEPSPSPSPSQAAAIAMAPAEPVRLVAASVGIDENVYAHESSVDIAISPRDAWSIAWWPGGGQPGATPENTSEKPGELVFTTYLYGHSGDIPAVFNDLKDLEVGDEIVLETTSGTYRYGVEFLLVIPKPDLSQDSRLVEDVPGRLVLISCWRGPDHKKGESTTENVVAVAQLSSFVPAAAHG